MTQTLKLLPRLWSRKREPISPEHLRNVWQRSNCSVADKTLGGSHGNRSVHELVVGYRSSCFRRSCYTVFVGNTRCSPGFVQPATRQRCHPRRLSTPQSG